MSKSEPTLRDVFGAVNELRGEVGEVRIGLGDVRGRLDRVDSRLDRVDGRLDALTGEVTDQGRRLDALTGGVETLGRETRELRTELPAQVVAGVLVGFERSAYATDLRTLQATAPEVTAVQGPPGAVAVGDG